jgi:lipoate-protein ligase A
MKPTLHVLRLAAGSLPLLDRLCLEEALLRADARNWLVTAHGAPGSPTIVLGVAGQLERLVHVEAAAARGASVLRRFSGGGTVVVDAGTLFAGFVLNQRDVAPARPLFPRDIMRWSEGIYAPVFARTFGGAGAAAAGARGAAAAALTSSAAATGARGDAALGAAAAAAALQPHLPSSLPAAAEAPAIAAAAAAAAATGGGSAAPFFSLREHDYCWGDRKVGGNAQSVSRERWVHHTSFLWDFDERNMQLLRLPERRPEYRRDRAHGDFVVALSRVGSGGGGGGSGGEGGGGGGATRELFLDALEARMREEWDVRAATLEEALEVAERPAARERRSNSVVPLPASA